MTTKVAIMFDTGNSAFDDGNGPEEATRILNHIAARIRFKGDTDGVIHDVNGNRVGIWSAEFPEADEDGTSGQDRESYSDDQDRDNYTTDE